MKRTKEEIDDKIYEILDKNYNFIDEVMINGHYEESYSRVSTDSTLREFVNWLYDKKIFK